MIDPVNLVESVPLSVNSPLLTDRVVVGPARRLAGYSLVKRGCP